MWVYLCQNPVNPATLEIQRTNSLRPKKHDCHEKMLRQRRIMLLGSRDDWERIIMESQNYCNSSVLCLGRFKQGVSKQRVTTFAWRPGRQHVAATASADNVLASDCRAQCGRPSTRRGCRMCVKVRLPVQQRGETLYWQANANTPLPLPPPFKLRMTKKGG